MKYTVLKIPYGPKKVDGLIGHFNRGTDVKRLYGSSRMFSPISFLFSALNILLLGASIIKKRYKIHIKLEIRLSPSHIITSSSY